MSRCRCCDIPLTGTVGYKEIDGKFVEEDLCSKCVYAAESADYIEIKSYQFENITESLFSFKN